MRPMEEMPRMRGQEGEADFQGYAAQNVTRGADYRGYPQQGEVKYINNRGRRSSYISSGICVL